MVKVPHVAVAPNAFPKSTAIPELLEFPAKIGCATGSESFLESLKAALIYRCMRMLFNLLALKMLNLRLSEASYLIFILMVDVKHMSMRCITGATYLAGGQPMRSYIE